MDYEFFCDKYFGDETDGDSRSWIQCHLGSVQAR